MDSLFNFSGRPFLFCEMEYYLAYRVAERVSCDTKEMSNLLSKNSINTNLIAVGVPSMMPGKEEALS